MIEVFVEYTGQNGQRTMIPGRPFADRQGAYALTPKRRRHKTSLPFSIPRIHKIPSARPSLISVWAVDAFGEETRDVRTCRAFSSFPRSYQVSGVAADI